MTQVLTEKPIAKEEFSTPEKKHQNQNVTKLKTPERKLSPTLTSTPKWKEELIQEVVSRRQKLQQLREQYKTLSNVLDNKGYLVTKQELAQEKKEKNREYTQKGREIIKKCGTSPPPPKEYPKKENKYYKRLEYHKKVMEETKQVNIEILLKRMQIINENAERARRRKEERERNRKRALEFIKKREERRKKMKKKKTYTGLELEMMRLEEEKRRREEEAERRRIHYPPLVLRTWSREQALEECRRRNQRDNFRLPSYKAQLYPKKKDRKRKKQKIVEEKPVEEVKPVEVPKDSPKKDEVEKPKEHPKRIKIQAELIQTEKNYVENLQRVFNFYANPCKEKNILTPEEYKELFSRLYIVKNVNETFLKAIYDWGKKNSETIMRMYSALEDFDLYDTKQRKESLIMKPPSDTLQPPQTTGSPVTDKLVLENRPISPLKKEDIPSSPKKPLDEGSLEELIYKLSPSFKLYTDYINNYQKSVNLACELQNTNKEFAELRRKATEQLREAKCRIIDLPSFLILPIQRIPRYRLLLEDLLKHTSKDHPDYETLEKATKNISAIADYCNQKKAEVEQLERVVEIAKEERIMEIVSPSRTLVYEDFTAKHKSPSKAKASKIHLYLFNDMLLIVKESLLKTKKYFKLPLKNAEGKQLIATKIEDGEANSIFVQGEGYERYVICESKEKRDKLYNAIMSVLEK